MATPETIAEQNALKGINADYAERFGFHDAENYLYKAPKGLTRELVEKISDFKSEPQWMREFRLKALDHFLARPMPTWGSPLLAEVDFDDIHYFVRASERAERSWDDVPEDVKKTFDRLGIPEAERKFLAGVGAQYECLAEESLVETARGQVPIRDVVAGDTVFAFDEERSELVPAPVKATARKGRRPVFRVQVGNRAIRATENHPFLCLQYDCPAGRARGRYSRRWKYLRDLRPGDLVAVSKQLPDVGAPARLAELTGALTGHARDREIRTPERTTPELMWWLGLYAGDGFIHRSNGRKRRVEIAIPATETALRTTLVAETEALFGITASSVDPDRVTVGSTRVADLVERLGFTGGAHEKRLPQWVHGLPQDQRLAFLAGYVDADGYVRDHPRNRDVAITSGNRELLEQVRGLALGCGLRCSQTSRFSSRHPFDRTRSVVGHRLFISGDASHLPFRNPRRIERVGRHRYTHDCSSAKGTTFRQHVNDHFGYVRIKSIEPDGEAEVYDIEVDGPHNFVAEGLIVHNSEVVYHQVREDLEKQGVIFLDMDSGLREHEELVREYFATIIPANDNKLAALNSAVWSGGSFVYVPPGVHVEMPLQAYFRINTENMGQFERTLIIADEGSYVHYVEGCTAPTYSSDSLHSAVVELIAKPGARIRYTTVQNWSQNVFNLVTKRAVAQRDATVEWVDCNLGSKLTMKYPSVYLMGERAHGEILSIAFAGKGQHQDAGGKIVHAAPNTTSNIFAKSISKDGGRGSYRGLLEVAKGAHGARSKVVCDALLLDEESRSDTYPTIRIGEDDVDVGHEATVSKIGEEQVFYLQSHGISEEEASKLIVNGFIEPITKELPMEYAVEMNRLIELQMEGSIG
jgi:Fe-S cluster assembly protein SufB